MVAKSADELEKSAEGNIKEENLTTTGGVFSTFLYDGPIIEHLNENEQPEFIFKHTDKGFRITEQSGDEITPHHGSGSGGRCYLLITSSRILYIAGVSDGDESLAIPYEKIANAEPDISSTFSYVVLKTKYGREYKFCAWRANEDTIRAGIAYINKKINSSIIRDSAKRMEDKQPVNTEPIGVLNSPSDDTDPSDDTGSSETSSAHEPDYTTRGKEVRISGNTNQKANCGKIEVYYDRIEVQQKGTLLSKGWITIPFKNINNLSLSTLGKLQIMTLNNDYRISGVGGQSGGKIQVLYELYPIREAIRREVSNTQITKEDEVEALKVLAQEKDFSEDIIQNVEDIIL